MSSIEFDYEIRKLSEQFYATYPKEKFKEILEKNERSYNCIILEISIDYFVCVPYRTEIKHNYAYHFKSSQRSIKHKSGLDYTKMIIVKNIDFIDSKPGIIDKDEFIETVKNIMRIKSEAYNFLDSYIKHIKREVLLHEAEFRRRYQFCPLQYFHTELGVEEH